jgi:hypothetical protein
MSVQFTLACNKSATNNWLCDAKWRCLTLNQNAALIQAQSDSVDRFAHLCDPQPDGSPSAALHTQDITYTY